MSTVVAQRIIQTLHGRGYRLVAPIDTTDRRGRSVVELDDTAPEEGATGLLERDTALRVIETAAAESAQGRGRVVLVTGPYRAESDRRWPQAADDWRERGMPCEEALALLELGGDGMSRARDIAVQSGARPLVDLIDRRRASVV